MINEQLSGTSKEQFNSSCPKLGRSGAGMDGSHFLCGSGLGFVLNLH